MKLYKIYGVLVLIIIVLAVVVFIWRLPLLNWYYMTRIAGPASDNEYTESARRLMGFGFPILPYIFQDIERVGGDDWARWQLVEVAKEVAMKSESSMPYLVERLKFSNEDNAKTIAGILKEVAEKFNKIDDAGRQVLALKDVKPGPDDPKDLWWIRRNIAIAIGKLEYREGIDKILEFLKDESDKGGKDVRREAAIALEKLKDKRAKKDLLKALNDSEVDVRIAAARAVSYINDEQVVEALKKTLESPIPELRAVSASGLALFGLKDGIPCMLKDLEDERDTTKKLALDTLKKITKKDFDSAKSWNAWWQKFKDIFKIPPYHSYYEKGSHKDDKTSPTTVPEKK